MSEKEDVLNLLVLSEDVVDFLLWDAMQVVPKFAWSETDKRRLALHKRLRQGWRNRLDCVPGEVWREILEELQQS